MTTPTHPPFIAPSILSCDFGKLGDEIRSVQAAGADWIHVDVMDGRFVPNITIGPLVVKAVRQATQLTVDVHLMIEDPDRYVQAFASAGADVITVHAEAATHLQRTLSLVRSHGKRAGVALNPHTPEEVLRYVARDLDLVLVMTVNPGCGGQDFLSAVVPKIARVRNLLAEEDSHALIEVDGGVRPETAPLVARAGAQVLVAGAAVFGANDYQAAISEIRKQAQVAEVA